MPRLHSDMGRFAIVLLAADCAGSNGWQKSVFWCDGELLRAFEPDGHPQGCMAQAVGAFQREL